MYILHTIDTIDNFDVIEHFCIQQ